MRESNVPFACKIFQLATSGVVPTLFRTAFVNTGSQNPRAADSATAISDAFIACLLGQTSRWPGDRGAMSRNATTMGVERTG